MKYKFGHSDYDDKIIINAEPLTVKVKYNIVITTCSEFEVPAWRKLVKWLKFSKYRFYIYPEN